MQFLTPVPREQNLFRYRDRPEGEVLDVEVMYLKGSSPRSRGLYLVLREVTVDDISECLNVFGGLRMRICALDRSSPALLRRVAEAADKHVVDLAALYRTDPARATTQFNALVAELAALTAE
jgi:hypothetical protein